MADPENEKLGQARFLCSQAVALSMKGIPAVYFHSLSGTPNNLAGVKETGQNRTINRKKWDLAELEDLLDDEKSLSADIFAWYTRTLRCRASCPAFHPDAPQKVLDLGSSVFALERKSVDGTLTVLCLFNFTPQDLKLQSMESLHLNFPDGKARDLIGGGEVQWGDGCLSLRPFQALWLSSN